MIEVKIFKQDDFEKMLKRFKKLCDKDGFLKEIKDRRFFKKPSEKKRKEKSRRERQQQ